MQSLTKILYQRHSGFLVSRKDESPIGYTFQCGEKHQLMLFALQRVWILFYFWWNLFLVSLLLLCWYLMSVSAHTTESNRISWNIISIISRIFLENKINYWIFRIFYMKYVFSVSFLILIFNSLYLYIHKHLKDCN